MKWICCFFVCFLVRQVSAQEKIQVMGNFSDMYIGHTITDGENLQSLGKQYSLPPAKIASYNQLNPAAPLPKNKRIKIPLLKDNLLQQKSSSATPIYYVIEKGDDLNRLSQAYNMVSINKLKDWNDLKSEVVKEGQSIIVGFMKIGKSSTTDKKETTTKPEPGADNITIKTQAPLVKTPEKKDPDLSIPKTNKTSNTPATKETQKPEENPVPETKKEPANGYIPKEGDEGYFALAYSQHTSGQLKQFHSGDGAIFKTITGWTDHKYYVLMNDVPVGSVVRITGVSNKSVCAKVLGPLQEAKGAPGLLVRISNSAAAVLGINDTKFPITVTYFE